MFMAHLKQDSKADNSHRSLSNDREEMPLVSVFLMAGANDVDEYDVEQTPKGDGQPSFTRCWLESEKDAVSRLCRTWYMLMRPRHLRLNARLGSTP